MLIAIWPLVMVVAGALVYAFASNGKLQNMGLVTFAVGMLWLGLRLSEQTLKLG